MKYGHFDQTYSDSVNDCAHSITKFAAILTTDKLSVAPKECNLSIHDINVDFSFLVNRCYMFWPHQHQAVYQKHKNESVYIKSVDEISTLHNVIVYTHTHIYIYIY